MTTEYRVLKFHIDRRHPDWEVAKRHCSEARRLRNALLAISREKENLFRNGVVDHTISSQYGVTPWVLDEGIYIGNKFAFESIKNVITRSIEISLPYRSSSAVGMTLASNWQTIITNRTNGERSGSPRYSSKYSLVEYDSHTISISRKNKGRVVPSQWKTGVKLPENITHKSARLYHSHKDVFVLEVLYLHEIQDLTTGDNIAAIDLGVNKLAAITFSDGSQPLLVDGKYPKSLNQGAHRNNAKREVKNKQRMWKKRNRRINHYMHSASSSVIRSLLERGVNKLVIGWNEGFKDSPSMGKKNNQRFSSLPLARFRDMLTYKARQVGIAVILQEESYTSKASFIDGDTIPVYVDGEKNTVKFSGRRVKRGMYKSANGTFIHADVNGSYNILRKSNPSFGWSSGVVVTPTNLKFSY